jgi:hypothetical protein
MEHYLPSSYPIAFVWGIVVLIGMIGLGRLLARFVDAEMGNEVGWGLHAVWGMGVYLFIGSILATCGVFREAVITTLICLGVVAAVWTNLRSGLPTFSALLKAPWHLWPAFLVAAVFYFGGIMYWGRINPCDDTPAYFYYCEKLLSTGSFDEPFSWRRLASLGGHTLLQCTVAARTSLASAEGFELAICPIILLGLIIGFRRGIVARTPFGLCLALAVVTVPIIRVNSASHLTGVVLFLGLFVTLDILDRLEKPDQRRRLRWLAVAGMIAASACTLRAQYVPAAVGALALFWLASWIRDRRPRQEMMIEMACVAGSVIVALLPWMIMGYRSNGSPLFPLFQGDNNLGFNPLSLNQSLVSKLSFPVRTVLNAALLPLILALFALPDWKRGLAARATSIAYLLASMVLAYSIRLAPDEETIPRYVQPLLLAGAVAALLSAAVTPRQRIYAWVMTLLWIGTTVDPRCDYLWRHYAVIQQSAIANIPYHAVDILSHRKAQDFVPAGSKILVCTNYPLLFDQQRNTIWNVDMPNAASPDPGLPFQKPPEETKRYLRSLGIEYLIFTDFSRGNEHELYCRPVWEQHLRGDVTLYKIQAPYYLDFFNTADALAASETVVGRAGLLTVVKLKP